MRSNCAKSVWQYECNSGACQKTAITDNTTAPQSFAACNLLCLDAAGLWPQPTGMQKNVTNLTAIDISSVSFNFTQGTPISDLVNASLEIFIEEVTQQLPQNYKPRNIEAAASFVIVLSIDDQNSTQLKIATDESYSLRVSQPDSSSFQVTINATTFFGARNGLETLAQLIVYDDLNDQVLIAADASIDDKPVYPWRGVILDTARNYMTSDVIKRTIKAMGMTKLNTFHWHLTDSASFPYVSKSRPELSQYGAYGPNKVYDADTIKDIIDYAQVRGVRVIPELDAPAHVGEGWQDTGFVTCFEATPWPTYCNEPPCGQFDPSQDALYDYLEDVYGDMLEQFDPEVFHMGGDEVKVSCWSADKNLTDWMEQKGWGTNDENFIEDVWPYFQMKAYDRLTSKAGKDIRAILWSSDLTAVENVTDILPVDKYYIQIWTTASDWSIQALLNKNYSIILSNYDATYLDCGFPAWVSTSGENWCAPYKGWVLLYNNKPKTIALDKANQVLGGEAALWTEQAEGVAVDSRIWPRASAYAEALWAEPATTVDQAETRMLLHRERLVSMGIGADALEPEWCWRNQMKCPTGW